MKILKAISVAWCNRPKKTWAGLNDWALSFIGIPSFLVGTFYLSVVWKVTPELVDLSQTHGLPFKAILAFIFVGGLAVSGLYFMTVAKRCYGLIVERNFK